MVLRLHHIIKETEHIWSYHFESAKPIHYSAGQFVELTIPHDDADNRGVTRWFTISSAPGSEYITITTKHAVPSSSFKRAIAALLPGDEVIASEPLGDFVLPKDDRRPLIFIAGGIGVTPFHSMLQDLVTRHEQRSIRFMYAVANEDEIIFQDTFAAAGVHATIVVEQPSPEWSGERGQLTADIILGVEQPSDDSLLYLSGPEAMVEHLADALIKKGISPDQVITDTFPGYAAL